MDMFSDSFGKEKELPWQNDLDAKKFLTEVHSPFKKHMGTDFKLAKFDDKDREFVMTILTSGISISDMTPNPDIGEELKEMDFSYTNALAILKFNQDGNMIVDRVTSWNQEKKEEETSDENFWGRLKKRISGEKKPKQEESD